MQQGFWAAKLYGICFIVIIASAPTRIKRDLLFPKELKCARATSVQVPSFWKQQKAWTRLFTASFFDEGNVTDVQGSRHLIRAALENGSPDLIYISIVGIDKSTFSYYRAKLEVERMIERSSLPWTIVRTTQFHDFVLKFLTSFEDKGASTITLPAGVRFQSIDTSEVAQYLANLAEQKQPAGHVPDMGGPQILTFEEIPETYKRIHNKQSVTIRSEPSKFYTNDAFPSGLNLVPDRAVGRTTWETFLLQQRA